MEVHFKIIAKRNAMFVKNQIASQLGTPLMSKRRHITSFAKVQKVLEIARLLQLIFKTF